MRKAMGVNKCAWCAALIGADNICSNAERRAELAVVELRQDTVTVCFRGLVSGSEVRVFRSSDRVEVAGRSQIPGPDYEVELNRDEPVDFVIAHRDFCYTSMLEFVPKRNADVFVSQYPDRCFQSP